MGGKALSKPSVRLPKNRYLEVESFVLNELTSRYPGRWAAVPAYRDKPDFGDLDILASDFPGPQPVSETLDAIEVVNNGPVSSMGILLAEGLFQVDFIKIPKSAFDFGLRYLAFNDLGNLIGRLAHAAGFKLGHLGLFYVVRDPENPACVIDEIEVSLSWDGSLEFLGYDSAWYQVEFENGFRRLEDVFQFAASSSYFDPDLYLLENISHRMRIRDKKRPTYMNFLKWLQASKCTSKFSWEDRDRVKHRFLEKAFGFFPRFEEKYRQTLEKSKRLRQFKRKFNGKLVSEWTGLSGKALGELMKQISLRFGDRESLIDFVLNHPQSDIIEMTRSFVASDTTTKKRAANSAPSPR